MSKKSIVRSQRDRQNIKKFINITRDINISEKKIQIISSLVTETKFVKRQHQLLV